MCALWTSDTAAVCCVFPTQRPLSLSLSLTPVFCITTTTTTKHRETPEGAFDDDIVQIIDVVGDVPGGERWADSYSVGDKCYMQTTFDHDIGDVEVDTPRGTMTINALFDALEPGPGSEGRPLYNDIQCGNGPPNTAGDEVDCPGLVEYGRAGCGQIGPMWDLSELDTIGPMWDR